MAKKSTVHICSECIREFSSKEIYSALKPNALLPHYTVYCKKCIDDLGIKEYTPYLKSRVSKSNDVDEDKSKTKNSTTTKTKNSTTTKTKNSTTTKTKNSTATKTKNSTTTKTTRK